MAMGSYYFFRFFDGDNEIDNEINGILVSPGNINELFLAAESL